MRGNCAPSGPLQSSVRHTLGHCSLSLSMLGSSLPSSAGPVKARSDAAIAYCKALQEAPRICALYGPGALQRWPWLSWQWQQPCVGFLGPAEQHLRVQLWLWNTAEREFSHVDEQVGQRHLGLIIPIIKCFIYFIRHLMFSMNLKILQSQSRFQMPWPNSWLVYVIWLQMYFHNADLEF